MHNYSVASNSWIHTWIDWIVIRIYTWIDWIVIRIYTWIDWHCHQNLYLNCLTLSSEFITELTDVVIIIYTWIEWRCHQNLYLNWLTLSSELCLKWLTFCFIPYTLPCLTNAWSWRTCYTCLQPNYTNSRETTSCFWRCQGNVHLNWLTSCFWRCRQKCRYASGSTRAIRNNRKLLSYWWPLSVFGLYNNIFIGPIEIRVCVCVCGCGCVCVRER